MASAEVSYFVGRNQTLSTERPESGVQAKCRSHQFKESDPFVVAGDLAAVCWQKLAWILRGRGFGRCEDAGLQFSFVSYASTGQSCLSLNRMGDPAQYELLRTLLIRGASCLAFDLFPTRKPIPTIMVLSVLTTLA